MLGQSLTFSKISRGVLKFKQMTLPKKFSSLVYYLREKTIVTQALKFIMFLTERVF